MSDNQPQGQDEVSAYEEGAFVDLADPNLQILDEDNDIVMDYDNLDFCDDEVDQDDDALYNSDAIPQDGADAEDLNIAPDRTPERDDAIATFTCPHRKPIHAVAVHPTKASLLAASGEGEVVYILQLDEARSAMEQLHLLKGHSDTVSLLSFSPNGQWLASGSLDSTVRIWSTGTWTQAYALSDLYGEIMVCLWHPTSLLFLAGAEDTQVAMWNVVNGKLSTYFVGHRGPVKSIVWSPDVKKVITGSEDGSIAVFNPKTGAQELNLSKDISPDAAGVTNLCFVNDDQCVVGCEDGTLHVFSFRAGRIVAHMEDLHDQAIESICSNAVLNFFATSSCDCKLIIWDTSGFTPRTIHEIEESIIPALWVNELLLAGCSDGSVRVWDGRSSLHKPLRTFKGHRRMLLSMATTEHHIITASHDGSVKVFNLPSNLFEEE